MQLLYHIEKARKLVNSMAGDQAQRMRHICREITAAQQRLNAEAEPYFVRCMQRCQGICCKNIHINEIVNILDLIYILTVKPGLYPTLKASAANERIFSADCLFLQNGTGPCLFPSDIKPERCILTFCEDTTSIRHATRAVRSKFSKLSRYTKLRRPFFWISF